MVIVQEAKRLGFPLGFQHGTQPLASPRQPSLHRFLTAPEHVRNLPVEVALDFVEHERNPQIVGQALDGSIQVRGQGVPVGFHTGVVGLSIVARGRVARFVAISL